MNHYRSESSLLAESLGAELWAVIAEVSERRVLRSGDVLIRQSETTETLYFIERGEVGISLRTEQETVPLGTRGAGHWVGEIGWLEPGPATAQVVALQDTVVHALDRGVWREVGVQRPGMAARWVRRLSEDLARRIRHAGVVLEGPAEPPRSPSHRTSWLGSLFGGARP